LLNAQASSARLPLNRWDERATVTYLPEPGLRSGPGEYVSISSCCRPTQGFGIRFGIRSSKSVANSPCSFCTHRRTPTKLCASSPRRPHTLSCVPINSYPQRIFQTSVAQKADFLACKMAATEAKPGRHSMTGMSFLNGHPGAGRPVTTKPLLAPMRGNAST
jgi:hypothetical protein